jgi:serine/threonine protein phosphatase 1
VEETKVGRRLIIADIHGCKRTFVKLLEKVNYSKQDELYLLGDMINRGKNSSGVLNHIIKLKKAGYKITALRGNHEQMLLNIINSEPEKIHEFLRNQNSEDLLNIKGEIKQKYLKFFYSLPYFMELDNFILVHAGLDLSNDSIFEDKEFMLSTRYQLGSFTKLNGKQLIHGHVSTDIKLIRKDIAERRPIISIDNGCIYTKKRKGFGRLICLNPDTGEIFSKSFCEREENIQIL